MAKNPFAFQTPQVTTLLVAVLLATFVPLLYVHIIVPPAPEHPSSNSGVNLTEAWLDLKELSNGFRPYNSHRNDEVHDWLLLRIKAILKRKNVSIVNDFNSAARSKSSVFVDNDNISNITFSGAAFGSSLSVYFEGSNIVVYVPGTEELTNGSVLVNAHLDSVSTGLGTTDDGMGVVTILQLISYFTANRPKRGIVFLLNNGEEDFLNGAYAFTRNPISHRTRMFLNLEGAGAGGRAVMFRSTDTEVTRFYKQSPHPVGSIFTQDGFERGAIRSQTDYVVFNGILGLRGLDVSFFEPRARYHTIEDTTKFDSIASLWQMLSNSLGTVREMSSDTGSEFDGKKRDDGFVDSGHGSRAVWFDIFGRAMAIFQLHTVFAVSVTLLVATPVVLILLTVALARADKWYPFARKRDMDFDGLVKKVEFGGWRGFFRYPIIFLLSTAALVALSFLLTKINPFIVYSSEYAVWSMMLSAWVCIEWVGLYGSFHHRPTALGRFFALFWMYIGAYILLIATTVGEKNFQVAGTYFIVIYLASVFFALLISYLELFALPHMENWARTTPDGEHQPSGGSRPSSRPLTAGSNDETAAEDEATERTSLLRSERQSRYNTYSAHRRSSDPNTLENATVAGSSDLLETGQTWSDKLPSWTWIFQLLLVAPINIILIGQIALLFVSGTHQTPADGNPVLTIYLGISVFSILMLTTLRPFLHLLSYGIWWLLAAIFVGTLLYNLLAFPFSIENRLKVFFVQRVDLDSGVNTVSLLGLNGYAQKIIAELPSVAGREFNCTMPSLANREGLIECKWPGLEPNVIGDSSYGYNNWLNYSVKRVPNDTAAVFSIEGKNTKSCRLLFDAPISDFKVKGAADDKRFRRVGKRGCREVRLWHRDWQRPWEVTVRWEGKEKEKTGMEGRVQCIWSDANMPGTVPALDEIWRFAPAWSIVTKTADGLVEGSKAFVV